MGVNNDFVYSKTATSGTEPPL